MSCGGRPAPLLGLYLFVAGLWTGALAFFACGAGIVLRAAPTLSVGGVVNRALLDALDVGSLAVSGLLLALAVVLNRRRPWSGTSRALSLRLIALGAVAAFVSLYLITPELVALREKAGPLFETLPAADPLRRAWGRLHALSLLTLLVRLVSGVAVFALGFRQARAAPPVTGAEGTP